MVTKSHCKYEWRANIKSLRSRGSTQIHMKSYEQHQKKTRLPRFELETNFSATLANKRFARVDPWFSNRRFKFAEVVGDDLINLPNICWNSTWKCHDFRMGLEQYPYLLWIQPPSWNFRYSNYTHDVIQTKTLIRLCEYADWSVPPCLQKT